MQSKVLIVCLVLAIFASTGMAAQRYKWLDISLIGYERAKTLEDAAAIKFKDKAPLKVTLKAKGDGAIVLVRVQMTPVPELVIR